MIKQQVLHNFSKQAKQYDTHASIQAYAAQRLAHLIALYPKPNSILEIGCGTGLLTRHLKDFNPDLYLVTDISSTMIHQCRQAVPHNSFLVMDGELLALDCIFDLVISNFAFQWFNEIENSMLELLCYGRNLAFAVPGPATFYQWCHLCESLNIESGIRPFLSFSDYQRIFNNFQVHHLSQEFHTFTFPHWLKFWQSIKKIGGHTPHADYIPQNLNAIKSHLLKQEAVLTYEVIFGIIGH
ncbi:MAG TPA: methyltransferase domain-containing protein [Candidatus Nitrosotenuis sp.]|jgi:malonyl-CoA O-methyltransferase|nr:methyltransferase domain-containing protein [Candidatus Nitrosotenuis sp.]